MSLHLLDALLQNARHQPEAVALCIPGQPPRTWAQLVREVNHTRLRISDLVRESSPHGADDHSSRGIRIVHESRNTARDVWIALACVAAGATEISIDSRLPAAMRRRIIDRSRGFLWDRRDESGFDIATDFDTAFHQLECCVPDVDIHQPSLVLWTSGTTDQPRGVMLSQHNLTSNARAKLRAVPQSRDDMRLTLLSLAHAYARTCDMGTWLLSGCSWTLDYGGRALDRIDIASPPTMINCVPVLAAQIAARLEAADLALDRLAVLGCGGAAMAPELFNRLRRCGVEVIQGYGCTETSPVICSSSPGATAEGLVGLPVDGCEIRIEDRRLFVRGPNVMLGYLDDPIATANKIDGDRWFDTGDLVEQQADRQLRILGRADDVIVLQNGFKLHPLALEQAIEQQHPSCDHAVVFSVDHQLIVAVQTTDFDRDALLLTIEPLLPPNTPVKLERLVPPLSVDRGELTGKKTPRRKVIRERFVIAAVIDE